MKIIILTATFLIVILAVGLLGLNNSNINSNNTGKAFAQIDLKDSQMIEGNDTDNGDGMTMNATLAYAAQHWSDIGKDYKKMGESIGKDFKKIGEGKGKEYRKMGENIGKEFRNIEKGKTITNNNSTSTIMMNDTTQASSTTTTISNATLIYTQN